MNEASTFTCHWCPGEGASRDGILHSPKCPIRMGREDRLLPRCDTCRWWDLGSCDLCEWSEDDYDNREAKHPDSKAVARGGGMESPLNGSLRTAPDFGCVQWEKKE